MPGIDESRDFIPVRIAVLTVSDSRTPATDRSGPVLIERLEKAGHILADRAILPDDEDALLDRIEDRGADSSRLIRTEQPEELAE